MFRKIAKFLPDVTRIHPLILTRLLEQIWRERRNDLQASLGEPNRRSNLDGYLEFDTFPVPQLVEVFEKLQQADMAWDHLIYAYMIENTRAFEIFRRVVEEFAFGEKLGAPTADSQHWLRATEELFFKEGAPFFVTSVTSKLRTEFRCNAYLRLLGMELNHGGSDGKPFAYVRAEAANTDFANTFEEFLREVWVGITYFTASASSNPTDPSKLSSLVSKLKNMLLSRRQNGNLSREEYAAVCAMSWFHLALESNTPIVQALRAEASGTEQRLFKIAERVGLPAHGLSKHFFDVADSISRILIGIEGGAFDSDAGILMLYTPGPPTGPGEKSIEAEMRNIITQWSVITGHDVKARKISAA